ncbi:hypothetical protein HanIR_Chr16g0835571 [Helianthus annuus]|nr:hypothetical protein HanIR_Chr16g0835571 [Helianthus annuus]
MMPLGFFEKSSFFACTSILILYKSHISCFFLLLEVFLRIFVLFFELMECDLKFDYIQDVF